MIRRHTCLIFTKTHISNVCTGECYLNIAKTQLIGAYELITVGTWQLTNVNWLAFAMYDRLIEDACCVGIYPRPYIFRAEIVKTMKRGYK